MSTTEVNRLNSLAKINSTKKYLEVGVETGRTFLEINAPFKVGVDPNFLFNFKNYADENTLFYPINSDEFWSNSCPINHKFDLIYLDGLHTFDQTFRDFCASQNHAHDNTIWLLDDTYPTDFFASQPDYKFVYLGRKFLRSKETFWMGDVFKVVFAIHDFFPQFRYATFPQHGQTVVWKERRSNFHPTWKSLNKISRMGYLDFLKFKDSHLNIQDTSTIIDMLNKWASSNIKE